MFMKKPSVGFRNLWNFFPKIFGCSLNVSPLHFEEPENFVKKICELIHTYQVDTSRLTFEITESTYVNNTEAVNQVIRRLKQLNIQISMDDFGSGYSPLNYTERSALLMKLRSTENSWGFSDRKHPDRSPGSFPYAETYGKIYRMRRCGNKRNCRNF